MKKTWFSIFDFTFTYKGTEPPFTDPDKFTWAKDIESAAGIIREELEEYLHKNNLQSYFNTSMVSKPNSWKTIALKTWSVELFKNQKYFPVTTALINEYPQIISASFNLLAPKSRILPHCGDTNAIYRCHLGLDIPAGLPLCGLHVKNEERAWENNKWLIFTDAYMHEAWNDTDKERFIFLMDVIKEEFIPGKKKICSTVLTSLFLQKRAISARILLKTKPSLVKFITFAIRPFASLSVYICNKMHIY